MWHGRGERRHGLGHGVRGYQEEGEEEDDCEYQEEQPLTEKEVLEYELQAVRSPL